MNSSHFRLIGQVTLFSLLLIFIGSCGGGGGDGGGIERTVALAYDTDSDGTPDIFDDYPDNAEESSYAVVDEADYPDTADAKAAPSGAPTALKGTFAAANSPDNEEEELILGTIFESAIGKDQPFNAPVVFKGSVDSETSPDFFAVYFEAGKTYSLLFYDPQDLNGRAVTFAPNVRVYTGNVSHESAMPDPVDEEPLQEPIGVISDYEELSLEFSLIGDARIICLSFTPLESRVHFIAVKSDEAVEEGASYQYRFDLIEDHDKDGARIHFKEATDGGNDVYTHEDILLLKSSMIPYVTEWADDGSPMRFGDGARNAFADTVNYLATASLEPLCSDQTSLNPFVSNVPWNSDWKFGYGIDASTGLPPTSGTLQAVNSFTPPLPDYAPTETKTKVYLINSDRDYEREIQAGFNTTFSSFGVTVGAEGSYLENVKYSETETTLILKYFVKETEYRVSEPLTYALTDSARDYLGAHPYGDDFRNQYGDYFIAGARYGARYVATLHIKAETAEKLREIETKLTQASSTYGVEATEEFKSKVKEITRNSTVTVDRDTKGGDDSQLSAGTTVDQMFDDLNTFIHSVNKENRAPLEAYMFRFNQIPDGYILPSEIDVNACVFSETRQLSKNYLNLSIRAKVIAELDRNTFQAGVQDVYAEEYETLIDEIDFNRQAIFRDVNRVKAYGAEVEAALEKFSALIDRQSFFLKLVEKQKHWPYHTEHKARESGFKTYVLSKVVDDDIRKPSKEKLHFAEYNEGWHVGYREWKPKWTPGSDSIVTYIKIWVDSSTKNDDCWDTNHPSLGRDQLSFHFKSGYDRKGHWKLWAKAVYLGENGRSPTGNYPFNWELMQ